MAAGEDNTTLNQNQSHGDVYRSEDIDGVKLQIIKMATGETGVEDIVSKTNPMPITGFPTTAFEEVLSAENTPVVQLTTQYGQLKNTEKFEFVGGITGSEDSKFFAESGASVGSLAAIVSRNALTYRAGQGAEGRFTGKFSEPVDGNSQLAGLLGVTDILAFGYDDTVFGIHYQRFGVTEIQDLVVTTPAGGAENATVTVAGIGFTVALTAGTVEDNAYEIAESLNSQMDNYDFDATNDTVTAVSVVSGIEIGSFAFSSSTAAASWSQMAEGAPTNATFIPEPDWNGGASFKITPDKLTPFGIDFEYLGSGGIEFKAENFETSKFELLHTLKLAGTLDIPSLKNPSFRLGWASFNSTSETAIRVEGASAGGFIQGKRIFTDPSRAFSSTTLSVSGTPTNIMTIRVRTEFGGTRNLAEVILALTGTGSSSTRPVQVQLIKNATFSIPLNYEYFDEDESVVQVATEAATITGGETIVSGNVGSLPLSELNQILIPGESLTIAMNITGGSASDMTSSTVWLEDQ